MFMLATSLWSELLSCHTRETPSRLSQLFGRTRKMRKLVMDSEPHGWLWQVGQWDGKDAVVEEEAMDDDMAEMLAEMQAAREAEEAEAAAAAAADDDDDL
eukprot:COSAG04_NODE_3019_length_3273_cov_2.829553_6_plen_100_part_00